MEAGVSDHISQLSEIAKTGRDLARRNPMWRNPMSCDDWDQEYHLTPRGWKTGSSKHSGRVDHEAPRPWDAVETWEQHASQASGWSREIRMQRLIWQDPAIREEDRKALRSKFQSPFQ